MIKLVICLLALAACGLPEKTHCTVTDDCLDGDICHAGVCQPGSHDACGPTRARCAADATCSDTPDGLACTCNAGYAGDGLSCADVDECTASPAACAAHASCANTPGSFTCTCDSAFTGDGTSYCVPRTFTKIAAAGAFSCGLSGDGGMYCWGNNALGDLGDGTSIARTRPTQVGTATDWIDVDTKTNTGCGIRADHSMWCWGFGNVGQLGDNTTMNAYTPVKVVSDKPGVGWKALAVGRQATCGIHDDGSLACWGLDRINSESVTLPVAVDGNTDWTDISVGTVRCGIRGMPGPLYCWGRSTSGDLGLGTTTIQATPAQVGTDMWKRVEVGYNNTCAIRSDNALFCWGNNIFPLVLQYGNTPQQIGTATDWQAVSLSQQGILGLRAGGNAYAWGENSFGQLGPSGLAITQPLALGGGVTGWTQLSTGNAHSCGIANGQAYCWGLIDEGLLGNGVTTMLYQPTRIGSDRWTAVADGANGQCGLREDGALLCWGAPGSTGIGFGNTDPVWAPARLGLDTWSSVTGSRAISGPYSWCAIRGGTPYCWGDNSKGQLGIGNTITPQLAPVAVSVPPGTWTEIAVQSHACAIRNDATLWCWGSNESGQLGIGTTSATPTTAPTVLGGAWLHVAVASYGFQTSMTCGIKTDHTLWCWGKDQPVSPSQHLVPTQVGIDNNWASLSLAPTSSPAEFNGATICAVRTNGALWCWGTWLGNGTTDTSPTPVQVGTATDWKMASVGSEICAVKTGGTLWCWGNNDALGDGKPLTFDPLGDLIPATRPTQIGSDTSWSTVSAASQTCATRSDGSLWCWGRGAATIPATISTPTPIN